MILADDQLNSFGIITKNDSNGKFVFAHHPVFSIDSKVAISRPKYEGLALIEADGTCPIIVAEPILKKFRPEVRFKRMRIAVIES